jgi:hypothetical protein
MPLAAPAHETRRVWQTVRTMTLSSIIIGRRVGTA